jgi:hypothetical protein
MRRELIEERVIIKTYAHSLLFENRFCNYSTHHARKPSMSCPFGKLPKLALGLGFEEQLVDRVWIAKGGRSQRKRKGPGAARAFRASRP